VNAVMNLWVPYNAGKFISGCSTGGLSSSAQLHRVSFLVSYLVTRVVRKIRFPRSCSSEERCYTGFGDTGV
jgi:hypothetical protein